MASSMPKAVSPRPAPTARAAADTIVPYSKPPLSSRDAHRDDGRPGCPRAFIGHLCTIGRADAQHGHLLRVMRILVLRATMECGPRSGGRPRGPGGVGRRPSGGAVSISEFVRRPVPLGLRRARAPATAVTAARPATAAAAAPGGVPVLRLACDPDRRPGRRPGPGRARPAGRAAGGGHGGAGPGQWRGPGRRLPAGTVRTAGAAAAPWHRPAAGGHLARGQGRPWPRPRNTGSARRRCTTAPGRRCSPPLPRPPGRGWWARGCATRWRRRPTPCRPGSAGAVARWSR